MSKRWPGGIITKNPATPTGPFQNGSAPGIWTIPQATYWLKQGLWPIAGNIRGWVNIITGTNTTNYSGINLDNAGNVVICGFQENGTDDDIYVAKLDFNGNVLWSRQIELGTTYGKAVGTPTAPAIDSSNNIYTCFNVSQPGSTFVTDWAVTKMASDGSLTSDIILAAGTGYDRGYAITWNGTGLVTVGDYNNTNFVCMVGLNTSLGVTANYQYQGDAMQPRSVTFDGSNYYMTARKNGFYAFPAYIVKVSSGYSFQWCSGLGVDASSGGSSPSFTKAVSIGTDVYACGSSTTIKSVATTRVGLLWKVNSSGVQQYQRAVGDSTGMNTLSLNDMAVTSDNMLVVTGQSLVTSGTNKIYVAKINPATPSMVWELEVNIGSACFGSSIKLDAQDNIYISGSGGFVMKLPSNGNVAGTYGPITITSVNRGIQTPATPEQTTSLSLTTATPAVSDQGGSFSVATQTYTSTLQTL